MIRIFTGDDRVRAKREIEKILGSDYEVIEGVDLEATDLPTVFYGNSLFTDKRKVLIRDLNENKAAWEKLPEYLESPHEIIIWEGKIDKRTTLYKEIKDKVEVREFILPKDRNAGVVFDIYKTAKWNGKKAVEMLESIKLNQEPMMFVGLMASQAIKEYAMRQGVAEKKVLKELSKLDMTLKSTATEPWLLIESFLLRLASL